METVILLTHFLFFLPILTCYIPAFSLFDFEVADINFLRDIPKEAFILDTLLSESVFRMTNETYNCLNDPSPMIYLLRNQSSLPRVTQEYFSLATLEASLAEI